MRFAILFPFVILAGPAFADPNEDCFKSQDLFHDLMINNSQAMLNAVQPIRSMLVNNDLEEISQPATIIYAIKRYGGSEMAMAVLTAWAEKKRNASYCSNVTEDECYKQQYAKIRSQRSNLTGDGFALLDKLPKLADEYMVVTGTAAVDYNPHLKRTTCRGSYTLNITALTAATGADLAPQDAKVLADIGRWSGKSSQAAAKKVNGQQTYIVQPDGQGGMTASLLNR